MKKLLYTTLAGLMLAATCTTPTKTTGTEVTTSTTLKQQLGGAGLIATLIGYGYAGKKYGFTKVNSAFLGSMAAYGGYKLGDALATSNVFSNVALALETNIVGIGITPAALITSAVIGGCTYAVAKYLIELFYNGRFSATYRTSN